MCIVSALIVEQFEIADRGAAVAIREVTELPVGKTIRATVVRPDGSRLTTEAFKEWLLRRDPRPMEVEAYLLRRVNKSEIPDGSTLELEAI